MFSCVGVSVDIRSCQDFTLGVCSRYLSLQDSMIMPSTKYDFWNGSVSMNTTYIMHVCWLTTTSGMYSAHLVYKVYFIIIL